MSDDLNKGSPPATWVWRRFGLRAKPPPEQVIKDGSWWKPDPKTMPVSGFMGYLTRDTTGKRLMPAQCRAFLDANVTVNLVGQDGKRQALRGATGGRDDAIFYNAQADEDGAPPWLPLAYAVADFDASRFDLQGPIHSYVGGALEAIHARRLRPFAPYGGIRTIDYLGNAFGDQLAWYWQTVAWSAGAISPYASLHQQAGAPWYPMSGPTDDNRLIHEIPRWGQQEEYDVALHPDDRAAIDRVGASATAALRGVEGVAAVLLGVVARLEAAERQRPRFVFDMSVPVERRPAWYIAPGCGFKVWIQDWHALHRLAAHMRIPIDEWSGPDVAAVPTLPGTEEPPA